MSEQQAEVPHDRAEQLKMVRGGLMANEKIFAVYDGKGIGTGFMAITDQRVLIQDKSFVGKKVALVSIPYAQIATVAVLTDANFWGEFYSKGTLFLMTSAGKEHEMEFRGVDKTRHAHDLILWHVTHR